MKLPAESSMQVCCKGTSKDFIFQVPAQATVIPRCQTQIDFNEAIRRCLDNPEHFPPLRHAVVASDTVAIAVQASVPNLELLLAIVVAYFIEAGVSVERIKILIAERCSFDRETFLSHMKSQYASLSFVPEHEQDQSFDIQVGPFNESDHAYVAADEAGYPIHLHRSLIDADFVLPIVQIESVADRTMAQVNGFVPWFADNATNKRWNHILVHAWNGSTTLPAHAKDLAWLINPSVVLAVRDNWMINSESIELLTRVEERHHAKSHEFAVDLVVMCMNQVDQAMNWSRIANGVESAAASIGSHHGYIVVVCEKLPKATLGTSTMTQHIDDNDALLDALSKSSDVYACDLARIAAVQNEHSIYLLEWSKVTDDDLNAKSTSNLPWESITSVKQLEKLIQHSERVLVYA
jgi:hypothetical protein